MLSHVKLFVVLTASSLIYLASAHSGVELTNDELPKLMDSFSVAKSPLEPVTLGVDGPHKRTTAAFENPSETSAKVEELIVAASARQTTRAVRAEEDQSKPDTSETGAPISESTESPADQTQSSATTESPPSSDSRVQDEFTKQDEEKSSSISSSDQEITTERVASSETTTTEPIITKPAQTSSTEVSASESPSTEAAQTDAPIRDVSSTDSAQTEAPVAEVTVTTEAPLREASTTEATQTEAPMKEASTTESAQTEAPSREISTLEPVQTEVPIKEAPSTPAPTPISDTIAPETLPPTSSQPMEISTISTPDIPTTTEQPSTTSATTSQPTVSTSQTQAVETPSRSKDADTSGPAAQGCNHLPSYNSEELQKVFREETTFKNGTIRGKFTYINYDQRYRLVHYTRLPYGPVKVDYVEELGRPEYPSSNGSRSVPNANDNSELQLRNVMPNSLFGFPFVPNQALMTNNFNGQQPSARDDIRNPYFYTTDTISGSIPQSPNLPPSSAEPDQQSILKNNNLFSSNPIQIHNSPAVTPPSSNPSANTVGPHSGFRPLAPIQTFLLAPNYRYPAINTLYSLGQPPFWAPPVQLLDQTSPSGQIQDSNDSPLGSFPTHQPFNHEHFVAPFLFDRPPRPHGQENDPSRVKLRVKSAKSLNLAHTFVSGSDPQSHGTIQIQPRPVTSVRRQSKSRHRQGKQNQDLNKPINSEPVVYHVLRSPIGRLFAIPPEDSEPYSQAYDRGS